MQWQNPLNIVQRHFECGMKNSADSKNGNNQQPVEANQIKLLIK